MTNDKTIVTSLNTNSNYLNSEPFQQIELFYQSKLYVLGRDELPFYIGRDGNLNHLAVDGDTVSRKHCILQLRDEQVGLLDISTNGTFVQPGRADSVFIRQEYYPLVGKGAIKLGQKVELTDPELILFKVVSR